MDHFIILLGSVLTGVLASAIWLLVLSRVRPKIAISDFISKTKDLDGNTVYRIKVINLRKRPAVSLKANLYLVTKRRVQGGYVSNLRTVPLRVEDLFILERYDKKDVNADYAYRFTVEEDLEALWPDDMNSHLSFRLYATDSLSSLGNVHRKNYFLKRQAIVDGNFAVGESMGIHED